MLTLLARWILNAAALLLVAYLYSGVHVTSFGAAMIAALVLGLVNAILRPILVILTLPVTLLTLGLAAEVVGGFAVEGFWAAMLGSILYSVITLVTSWLLFPRSK